LPRWFSPVAAAGFAISFVIAALLTILRWSMLDLQIYRWAGLVVRHGGDLYGLHFPHYRLSFTYPPMAALIFAAAAPISLSILKWLVVIGNVACLVAVSWLTWGALGYRRQADRVALALATAGLALWLDPVLRTLSFGQVNLVLMLIVVADFQLPDSRWFKGIGIGLAAGFKLTPLIFIPYLLLTRRFRAAGVALATFALTIAGSPVLLPAQSRQFWFGGLVLNPHRIGKGA
jgi:alpha-1,2-mannosyltransferase